MFEKLEALKGIHEAARKQLRTDGEAALKAAFRDFFAKHPSVTGIQWAQYTPYWNDGDACVFSVNEPRIRLDVNSTEDEDEDEDEYLDSWDLAKLIDEDGELYKDFSQLASILQSDMMTSVLLHVFGDHAEITATRDSIEVDSYDHE